MKFGQILGWLFIFVVGSLIVSFILNPGSFNKFTNNVGDVISDIIPSSTNLNLNANQSTDSSGFGCENELKEWLKEEKIKNPSSASISIVEKRSFMNKTELLEYVNKWGVFNEYEIKRQIEEITKIPELNGNYDLTRDGNNFVLSFNYEKGEIKSMRLLVTKGYLDRNRETICDKTIEDIKGKIECDVSDYGQGEYYAEAYLDKIDKFWEGKIDTVLVKEEGKINGNDRAILIMGICEEGKLIFN